MSIKILLDSRFWLKCFRYRVTHQTIIHTHEKWEIFLMWFIFPCENQSMVTIVSHQLWYQDFFYSIPKIIKRRHVFVVVVLGLTLEYFAHIDNIFAGKGLWHLELCPLSCVSHQLWHRSQFCGLIWMTNQSKTLFTTSKGSYGLTWKTWLRGFWGDTKIAF